MAKFRWTKDGGSNWIVVDSDLPYNIAGVVESDSVTVEPIGTAVTIENTVTVTYDGWDYNWWWW